MQSLRRKASEPARDGRYLEPRSHVRHNTYKFECNWHHCAQKKGQHSHHPKYLCDCCQQHCQPCSKDTNAFSSSASIQTMSGNPSRKERNIGGCPQLPKENTTPPKTSRIHMRKTSSLWEAWGTRCSSHCLLLACLIYDTYQHQSHPSDFCKHLETAY